MTKDTLLISFFICNFAPKNDKMIFLRMKTSKMRTGMMAFALCAALAASVDAQAETVDVKKFKYVGPYPVTMPWMGDSVNVKGEKFGLEKLLDSPLSFAPLNDGKEVSVLAKGNQDALHLASFTVTNESRVKATIAVEGLKSYRLFVDGEQQKVNGDKAQVTLMPSTHNVVVKYLTSKDEKDEKAVKVSVTTDEGKNLELGEPSDAIARTYNIYDVICAPNYPSVASLRTASISL